MADSTKLHAAADGRVPHRWIHTVVAMGGGGNLQVQVRRLAKPGEFTLRAFLSGRIDLTQAEAVLAVIDSSGDRQLNTALQQLAGGLAGPLGGIRNDLMNTLAELEAGLDFVEEDIEFISRDELIRQLDAVHSNLNAIASQISQRDLTADCVKVVLDGEPNSGKSSLFNALTDSNQAIVTDVAGTTTDFLSARLIINSAAIELIDTAGFENAAEPLAEQAQKHRSEQLVQADVHLFCIDATRPPSRWELDQLATAGRSTIVALTKSDLLPPGASAIQWLNEEIRRTGFQGPIVVSSVVDPNGLSQLRDQIAISVLESEPLDHSVVSSTVLRASESLRAAKDSVQHALDARPRPDWRGNRLGGDSTGPRRIGTGCRDRLYRRHSRPGFRPLLHWEIVLVGLLFCRATPFRPGIF